MSRPNIKRPNSLILPVQTDSIVPNERPLTNSRSMSYIDSLKDGVNIDNIRPIKKWTYLDASNKGSSVCSSDRAVNINMNEPISDKNYFHQPKLKSPLIVNEDMRLFAANSSITKQNSSDSLFNKLEGVAKAEMEIQRFLTKSERFQNISQIRSGTNDGTDNEKYMSENNTKEKVGNGREYSSKNSCFKGSECDHSTVEKNVKTKIEVQVDDDKASEDQNSFDCAWKNYVDRPLLPLKPLHKQRSLSCTNLVQTIKGLSKRKVSANNRFSSPEDTLFESRELCTSEANLSNLPTRTISVESEDQNFRRFTNSNDSSTTKKECQSLQHYTWYHSIDAKEANKRLMKLYQNGAFLIRPTSNPTSEVFHTLCVVCLGRVYNFHIKNLKDGRITIATKNKKLQIFSSLLDMIKYHQTVPITINIAGQVMCVQLLITPPK